MELNKRVIRDNKKEFDYWIDGGDLIWTTKESTGIYFDFKDDMWIGSRKYIINDDYVEFRKAENEGKILEVSDCGILENNEQWHELNKDNSWIVTLDNLIYNKKPIDKIRVKTK